ncbi:uncharacterized protein BDZ99DRAFT_521221 [Mytilinidion resinicola]|uniref:Protein transport protein sec73 n=1 Tax=Mytilinidion resinicola TaxID=574789 RepID=A0A6A6YJM1_9PEZI|nr:uncharacterized protein BDZ99DRAFT_521221 [Mytilinidion resinicola]KAF2808723.1 hypothetical protein BDZ99DRAFT_521221 [Mytilinidion resinicola]
MPLRALRPNRSERDLQRRSTLDPGSVLNRGDKARSANASREFLEPDRAAVSHDGGRPPGAELGRASWSGDTQEPPPSPPIQDHTPNTKRFSIMRFRHASDSQLSVKAKEHAAASAPPVPAIPQAPAIIMTAPTVDLQGQIPKNKPTGRLQQFARRRMSFDPDSAERPNTIRKSMDKKRRPFGNMRAPSPMGEDPQRLSTSHRPNALPESSHHEGNSTLSLPVPRMSDSSRSDGSSGDHVHFASPPKPKLTSNASTGRFKFGRRNKQRASLFPLPMKIDPPKSPNAAPATPRASTSAISSSSANHSPGGYSPPLTAIHRTDTQDQENDRTSSMPSPTHVALAASSMNIAAPGSSKLLRNDSLKSIHSARSSPNTGAPMRLGLRGRSSTMGSMGGRSDDAPPPTPPFVSGSGRNSTSTVGRSSLSNLFGLGQRFRQNSEPHSPRYGTPALSHGTPGLSSHNNSLNISREALIIPKREEGEAPGRYLERLEEVMDRSVIASVLSKTSDAFMLAVLRSYMRKFHFFGDPIDMAIRKLLMEVELPKETQQIDRVLQGFADRYHECNPGIYINPDKAYFISFSIVILHTDVFNKNNKRKMQRQDYIKNSSCEGVADDVLGCIYDNIVYTPFIHFEDDIDIKGTAAFRSKKTSVFKAPMSDPARKATREPIDPYTLIFENKLDALRPNIKDVMNLDDPYSYLGTAQSLDARTLYSTHSKYGVIQIVSSRSRPEAFMSAATQENPNETQVGIVEMPVTKVGTIWRKDTKRKAARSPWQEWGAILTQSGLSFFKNHGWVKTLTHQHEQHQKLGNTGPVIFTPPVHDFKPDHVIPMDGTVALVDTTYRKHKHSFVIYSKGGTEETFLADNETDLNDWLGKLNYSAAFETLSVRPRGLTDGQRNRGFRRLESSQSTKSISTPTGEVTIESGRIDKNFAEQISAARRELMIIKISESEERLAAAIRELEGRLRDARHLQIMAPIQPKTRELVIIAAGRMAARLKWIRIEIWRMKCHRDILALDLEEEKNMANERQARIDRITGKSTPQTQPEKSSKASKIGSLARLNSKAGSLLGGKGAPLSPSPSARPGTKSSRETDFGEDIFKTPPEHSRQSSPSHVPGQYELPPLSFSPVSSNHRGSLPSAVSTSGQSPTALPREHRPSVSTLGDRASETASETPSHYTTPPPIEDRSTEPQNGLTVAVDGARPDTASESDADRTPAAMGGSPESRSKVRRSLHRTLRDSHSGSNHRRGGKGKGSNSTIVSDEAPESEGLSRAKGSFTVHGKKASVITFGADWQDIPAEDRLKVRKQAQEAVQESGEESAMSEAEAAPSIKSSDTAPVLSDANIDRDEVEDVTPRPSTNEKRAKPPRHVSSQTITPHTSSTSVNGKSKDENDDTESEDEVGPGNEPRLKKDGLLKHKHSLSEEEDSGPEHVTINGLKTQAVEA